jgi:3-hydroxyacyl-[acyl-carrier-protein] dehydratase
MRYFLLDKVTAIDLGKSVAGVKCITLTDPILHDHFPDFPVMPGALLTESMAQLAGFLLETTINTAEATEVRRAVLAQIEKMKFYKTSGPGDRLDLRATIDSMLDDAVQVSVEASSEGEVRAKGRLTFAMLKIDSPRVTQQRMELYKIWTRDLKNVPALR